MPEGRGGRRSSWGGSVLTAKTAFPKPNDQSGVTVVELLVVIVIIAIVAAFAMLQRGSANAQLQRQNVAQQLKVAFERARFDSVKRRAECDTNKAKVIVNASSFTLWTDKDLDNNPEPSEVETTNFSSQNIVIAGVSDGPGLPATVAFNQRGEVLADDGSTTSTNPGFLVCNGACPQTLSNNNANKVYVTPTGTVDLLSGSQSPPTFGAPGGTTVGTGAEINENMVLTSSNPCPGP